MGNVVLVVAEEPDDDIVDIIEDAIDECSFINLVKPDNALRTALKTKESLQLIIIVADGPEDEVACRMLTMFKLCPELSKVPTLFYTTDSEEDGDHCPKCGQLTLDDDDDSFMDNPSPPPKPN